MSDNNELEWLLIILCMVAAFTLFTALDDPRSNYRRVSLMEPR